MASGIDLHLHSTASDGTDSPGDLVRRAAAAGLHTVALTDNDTTAGWAEATAAAREAGVRLLPGAELSADLEGCGIHLLSYLHDPEDPALIQATTSTQAERVERARTMVTLLAQDYPISWEAVLEQAGNDATVGRPHIADALIKAGVVADRDEAFATMLNGLSPYYVPYPAPEAHEVVKMVRQAGGVAVLAHPGALHRGHRPTEEQIASLAAAGLHGLEVEHPDHDEPTAAAMRALAAELNLIPTGSSDFHGSGKRTPIGMFTTAQQSLDALIAAGTGARLVGA